MSRFYVKFQCKHLDWNTVDTCMMAFHTEDILKAALAASYGLDN